MAPDLVRLVADHAEPPWPSKDVGHFPDDTARLPGYLDLRGGDNGREYLALFSPQVAFGATAFGGTSDRSLFTGRKVDEYVRIYSRPTALSGGFELIAPWARTCGPGG
ncbi:hypothetical protein AABB02_00500 [Streptomyces rimosus]|uniref:hypothetical protein n=1 Tax=Streptomyces rimosus TaxID=1927 RepID=UPI0031D07DE3